MIRFVDAIDARGKRVSVPEHWFDSPRLGHGLRRVDGTSRGSASKSARLPAVPAPLPAPTQQDPAAADDEPDSADQPEED